MQVIRIKASGPRALFSRPEMKVERVSYDVITPSAARGILEAIHWKPQMVWRIRSKGGEVWYLAAKDEGHGFRKKSNRDAYLETAAQFLEKLKQ